MALVEEPNEYQAVASILKNASESRRTVTPKGGGTSTELGERLKPTDIVLSLRNLARVLDHQPANLTVRTQAGITLGVLNQTLAQQGQYLPLDPPFPDRATVGGVLAANASGSLRVRFGAARDQLIGLRVALTDGQVVHGGGDVVKNVAGYDLPKVFVGSLGTLGIIVEATFKLSPLPSKTVTIAAEFEHLTGAVELAHRALRSQLLPYGLEVLGQTASAKMGLGERSTCVTRFGGLAGAVKQQLREVEAWSSECGAVSTVQIDPDVELWARLRDFVFEMTTVVKIGVLPTQIGPVAAEAEKLADLSGLTCVLTAHAVGILYIGLEGDPGPLEALVNGLRTAAAAHSGHLVLHRASGELVERVGAWGPAPPSLPLMKKLKQELDPNGILNPGRFVGGI
jgi:glycolate dehydrogenase FAD-binding subunit